MTIALQRENSSNLKINGFKKYSVAFLLSRIFIKLHLKIQNEKNTEIFIAKNVYKKKKYIYYTLHTRNIIAIY